MIRQGLVRVKEVNNCDDGKRMDLVPIIKYQTPPNTRCEVLVIVRCQGIDYTVPGEQEPCLLYDDN